MQKLPLLSLFSLLSFLSFFFVTTSTLMQQTISFDEPIDAISLQLPHDDAKVMIKLKNGWHQFIIEKELDPLLMETDLVMLPKGTDRILLRGDLDDIKLHPIQISDKPPSYSLAAQRFYRAPRILSRSDWGADDLFLFQGPPVERSDTQDDANASKEVQKRVSANTNQRVNDCKAAHRNHSEDFRTTKLITHNAEGTAYRWPLRYSPDIKLLVLHHTAQKVAGDTRSAVERMRAMYKYHANSLGWGDVGYHYIIDEAGTIYEGRYGGDKVVGGHTYCGNVGTKGIVLMGNFDVELPTQSQVQAAQWLLHDLAKKYNIDLRRAVNFKGKKVQPILRHKDLIATECPGRYLSPAITQIRGNVIAGNVNATVDFPRMISRTRETFKKQKTRLQEASQALSRRFYRTKRQIRTASRNNSSRLQFYRNQLETTSDIQRKRSPRTQRPMRPTGTLHRSNPKSPTPNPSSRSDAIRIRLSYESNIATIESNGQLIVNGQPVDSVRLGKDGNSCIAITSPSIYNLPSTISISSDQHPLTITSWPTPHNRFRGTIECRIVDGELALINELPLEQYLMGLSEQPDSEPREKQKAFAIAARSYAAFYMQPGQEKFAGKPYHGSDTGASFQNYSGVTYEEQNPKWVQSVLDTKDQVIMKDGDIIKAAYFSSSDGKTRSPEQNGWKNFPHSEVFRSKLDPWCKGMKLHGHGVGMSGCGARAQALQGKRAEEILEYYYSETTLGVVK